MQCKVSTETVNTRVFKAFANVFSTPDDLLVGISGAPGITGSHFLNKNVYLENTIGNLYLRNSEY